MSEAIAIIGAAATPVDRYARAFTGIQYESDADRLARVAGIAIKEAGIEPPAIASAAFTGMLPGAVQQGFGVNMASRLGLNCRGQISECHQLGVTGGLAFDAAAADVLLGRAEYALALGVSYMTEADPNAGMEQGIRAVGDAEFQAPFGGTPIAWYAMAAARYLHETQATREDLAAVAVKSRRNAIHNPLAQFRSPIDVDHVLNARLVVEPLRLLDVPAVADGAICLVLCSESTACRSGRPYVRVTGRGFSHDGHHGIAATPQDMTRYPALTQAASTALDAAKLNLDEVDLAELYAPCSITEVLATESLGWFKKGQGASAAAQGDTARDGRVPINTSGGCLSRGHPPSLTGLYGLLELRDQLLGRAGERQVRDAKVALSSCEGGNYNVALVHILEAA